MKPPEIVINIIPHKEHRYIGTCGDWFRDENKTLVVNVSDMGDKRYAMCVAIHEIVEALLCEHDGVKEEDVTRFDMEFEASRTNDDEPGDNQKSPYARQHCIATAVERLLCAELGLAWNDYDGAVNAL